MSLVGLGFGGSGWAFSKFKDWFKLINGTKFMCQITTDVTHFSDGKVHLNHICHHRILFRVTVLDSGVFISLDESLVRLVVENLNGI